MCLHTNQKKAKRAEKDIICYKYFISDGDRIVTPFQYKEYPKNGIKVSRFSKDERGDIEKGLHTFSAIEGAKRSGLTPTYRRIIRKMYIPKGTLYYEGTYGGHSSLASLELKFYSTKKKKL